MGGAGRILVLLAVSLGAGPARAEVFRGGGSSGADCLVVFDVNVAFAAERPSRLTCVDGDPDCDRDGVVDGVCEVEIAVCANSTADPDCSQSGVRAIVVEHAIDNGDPRFDPELQALQTRVDTEISLPNATPDQCTLPVTMRVPVKGPRPGNRCRRGVKKIKLLSDSEAVEGTSRIDRDRLRILCEPAPGQCDPQIFYTSTFDRIQTQILSQNCALSGCHDSQSQTGGLLLEPGTSYSQLVGVTPSNSAASASGWKRVTVIDSSNGDPETSFFHQKLEGKLAAGFGARMPFGGRRLRRYLREVVELWILSGAPATGWVPGTD